MEDAMIELGTMITQFSADAWVWVGNFLVLIVLTLLVFVLALRRGSSGLITMNLALYCGYALYIVFPYREAFIGIGNTPIVQAILTLVLFLLLTAGPFVIILRLTAPSFGQLSIIQNFILSVLAAGFLLALGYHVFDISNVYSFSEPLNQLFAPKGYFFWWFAAPLIGLYFLAR